MLHGGWRTSTQRVYDCETGKALETLQNTSEHVMGAIRLKYFFSIKINAKFLKYDMSCM